MPRDKGRDHDNFNCNQEHEKNYVSGLYADKKKVYDFLTNACADNRIKYSTHIEVYRLIEKELGFPIPKY